MILERSADLADVNLQVGDEVRMDPAFKVALELLQTTGSKEYFIEDVPPTPWESIGGQEEAIQAMGIEPQAPKSIVVEGRCGAPPSCRSATAAASSWQ